MFFADGIHPPRGSSVDYFTGLAKNSRLRTPPSERDPSRLCQLLLTAKPATPDTWTIFPNIDQQVRTGMATQKDRCYTNARCAILEFNGCSRSIGSDFNSLKDTVKLDSDFFTRSRRTCRNPSSLVVSFHAPCPGKYFIRTGL